MDREVWRLVSGRQGKMSLYRMIYIEWNVTTVTKLLTWFYMLNRANLLLHFSFDDAPISNYVLCLQLSIFGIGLKCGRLL